MRPLGLFGRAPAAPSRTALAEPPLRRDPGSGVRPGDWSGDWSGAGYGVGADPASGPILTRAAARVAPRGALPGVAPLPAPDRDEAPLPHEAGARHDPDPRQRQDPDPRAGQDPDPRAHQDPDPRQHPDRRLRREPEPRLRRDPAPTRWSYRYQRMMLTPLIRAAIRVGLPAFAVILVGGLWFTSEGNRTAFSAGFISLRDSIQNRPEFLVTSLRITGAEAALTRAIDDLVAVEFPVSSFVLDLPGLRDQVTALSAVKDATVGIRAGGVLEIDVTERRPVAVWRYADGLRLIDAEGQMTGMIANRSDRADLPLIAGDGAKDVIAEAMELFEVAGPLAPRLRGLVRMGERRWDVVLDRDQRILLPATGAVAALARVVALDQAQDMLARDITVVDMRASLRPTIRLNRAAISVLRNVTETVAGTTE